MKKVINVTEVDGEGLEAFLGQKITVYCFGFIYTGILEGVNDRFIKLKGAKIVYSTGSHQSKDWETAEPMPNDYWYVMLNAIESFGDFK